MTSAHSIVVLDFETTGLSPEMGDRAIEIGAVRIENGQLGERFQRLMNPGRKVPTFIEQYTGITNAMLSSAPSCSEAMAEFADFIGDSTLLAHNASFDKRFLDAELHQIRRGYGGEFLCSLLVSRRLLQQAPNHQLGTLVDYCGVQTDGQYHRALYDAEMTAHVWLAMLSRLQTEYGIAEPDVALMKKISKTPKKSIGAVLAKLAQNYA